MPDEGYPAGCPPGHDYPRHRLLSGGLFKVQDDLTGYVMDYILKSVQGCALCTTYISGIPGCARV